MYNTDFPDRADLPTAGRLVRSTIIAGISAVVILITIVLPSEYGIDPTRVGSLLQLTPMGEIKVQLAQEAAAQAAKPADAAVANIAPAATGSVPSGAMQALERRVAILEAMVSAVPPSAEGPQSQPEPVPLAAIEPLAADVAVAEPAPVAPSGWRDEVSFTLTPGQGTEYKMVMPSGGVASYEFAADGGVINFDAHGEGTGQKVSYQNGRGVMGDSGTLTAPFEGTHGWFFRNRGSVDVVVTLRTRGDYVELRKLI